MWIVEQSLNHSRPFCRGLSAKQPIMVYSLDTYLEEWVADHREELEDNNNLTLEEILSQHLRIRSHDKEIDNEIINAVEKVPKCCYVLFYWRRRNSRHDANSTYRIY